MISHRMLLGLSSRWALRTSPPPPRHSECQVSESLVAQGELLAEPDLEGEGIRPVVALRGGFQANGQRRFPLGGFLRLAVLF